MRVSLSILAHFNSFCRNCHLKFDSPDELANHQRKFCVDSDYGNVTKLDRRLLDLNQKDPKASLGLNEVKQLIHLIVLQIKQYLRGEDPTLPNKSIMGDYTLDELRGYFQTGKLNADDKQQRSQFKKDGDMIDQMKSIKKEKHLMRMQKETDEGDLMDLMRDLEQRKEKELRAQIEKEEIQRNLKDLDKKQLSAVERERKKELERLVVERENLRMREQSMLDEVKKMEQQLLEQEKYFRKQKDGNDKDPNRDWAMNDMRKKEMELARERGERIVQVKAQRDKLERERERIMEELDKVKAGNLQGLLRRNDAARIVGDHALKMSTNFNNDRFQAIEPSLKDKLINDTVRVNYLREQQRRTMNEMMPEIDELDILQKELENRSFINEAAQMANDYDGRNSPNRPQYLSIIRQKLENQAAAPSSYPNNPANVHFNGDDFQADLPEHIPGGEGKKVMIDNLKGLKDEYLTKGGEDVDFINKVNDLENFLLYRKPLQKKEPYKPGQPPQVNEIQVSQNMAPFMPPPGMFPPGMPPPMGGMPPFSTMMPPMAGLPPYGMPNGMPPPFLQDPMMLQMQQMLQQQELENQRLKDALEGIGPGGSVNEFDNIINQTSKELDVLKSKILPGGLGTVGGGNDDDEPFPEDFVFRQNEFRCEDLEVEERALMNVAAQEYDSLRVISKLPVNSELYRYKMDQYKELSTMRAEIEKVLQEQRLEKIRRDFEKQKYEDERRFKHEKWLEDQKRQILEAKLKNAGRSHGQDQDQMLFDNGMMAPQTSQQQPMSQQQRRTGDPNSQNQQQQQPMTSSQNQQQIPDSRALQTPKTGGFLPQKVQSNYDANTGFILFLDHLYFLPREYRQIRLVYSVFIEKKALVEPRLIEMKQAEADFENPNFNKVFFNAQQILKHVKQHPSANLIIEIQVPDPNKTQGYSSFGWTLINVFDSNYKLKSPTVLDLDVRDIYKLSPLLQMLMCIRICYPKDEVFVQTPTGKTNPGHYNLPQIHDVQRMSNTNPAASGGLLGGQFPPGNRPPTGQQNPYGPPLDFTKKNSKGFDPYNNDPLPMRNQGDQFVNPPQGLANRANNYEVSGMQLFIHFLRNLKNFSKMKLQATLYEGVGIVKQDNYQDCNWATTGVEKNVQQIAPKGSRVEVGLDGQVQIYKPPVQDLSQARDYGQNVPGSQGQDEFILPINQETTWQKDLYNMLWDHNVKDNLYLLIQVFIIVPRVQGSGYMNSTNYEAIGYTVFQVNNDDGSIRFGTYEQSIYRMPINLFQQDPSQLMPTTIKFSIVQPRIHPLSAKNQLPSKNVDSRGKPHSSQFIPNFDKQWTPSEDFQQGDGVDVYVDWARFLPENAMFSRVFVRVVESNGNYPIAGSRGYASIDFSTARNPFYGFKYEIRGTKDPTLMLMVTFETIDRSTGQSGYAGHSYFPLFMDRTTRLPVTDTNARSFTLHKGYYQMPVFCQMPLTQPPITYENFIYLERIPTASMLLRVFKAPKMADGTVLGLDNVPPEKWGESDVLIQAPTYQEGVYSTQYFFNTPLENRLFYIRKGRKDYKLAQMVDRMLIKAKMNPTQLNEDQKLEELNKMINVGPNATMIDMNYFSQYNAELGFRCGVEALYNNNVPGFFGVIASVCPMATLYDVNRVGPPADSVAFTTVDWNDTIHTIKFLDGQFMFQNVKETPGMSVIFDIKRYEPGQNKYEDFGFAIFPLFTTMQNEEDMSVECFVNSGIYQIPVFSGLISQGTINDLKSAKDANSVISSLSALPGRQKDCTLIVKVVDNQRERHFEKGFEELPVRTKFLPQSSLKKIQYQPLSQDQLRKFKRLQDLLPKGEQVPTFQQFLTDFLHTQYKL